jgi:hypothetical protein
MKKLTATDLSEFPRTAVAVALLAIAFLLVPAAPSFAGGHGAHDFDGHHRFHGHGVIVVGPGCCWGPYPPQQVVVQPAPVYVEGPTTAPPESYWYYCPGTKAYYPSVVSCSEAWVKVPPQ